MKYYTVKIFILQCHLLIKFKTTYFRTYVELNAFLYFNVKNWMFCVSNENTQFFSSSENGRLILVWMNLIVRNE